MVGLGRVVQLRSAAGSVGRERSGKQVRQGQLTEAQAAPTQNFATRNWKIHAEGSLVPNAGAKTRCCKRANGRSRPKPLLPQAARWLE